MPKQDLIHTNLGVSPQNWTNRLRESTQQKIRTEGNREALSLSSPRIALHSVTHNNTATAVSLRQASSCSAQTAG